MQDKIEWGANLNYAKKGNANLHNSTRFGRAGRPIIKFDVDKRVIRRTFYLLYAVGNEVRNYLHVTIKQKNCK